MFLQSITLQNFKNYEKAETDFCNHFNCIIGLNGSGKTNILDAINYLSMTKSAFNSIDAQNIKHESDYFLIRSRISKDNKTYDLHCSLKKNDKKLFKVDGSEYEKLSQHMGKFPVVLIAPNDDELIRESNEVRRKFFDSVIGQSDSDYLTELIKYNYHLKQRNALLKKYGETQKIDKILLESYNQPMIASSLEIARKRESFIHSFIPHFESCYSKISEDRDKVHITYKSKALYPNFKEEFANGIEKDLTTQRTNLGIHRDEYQFIINDFPVKKYGSQGQQKSLLVSLKLAQFEFIKTHLNLRPILLLDDIFDKLDDSRINKLMEIIGSDQYGQIFITDAREERTRSLLVGKYESLKIFRIENNTIMEQD